MLFRSGYPWFIAKNQGYPVFMTPLAAVKALDVSATYYEEKKARDGRGAYPEGPVDKEKIAAIRARCNAEKRIPLTDEALDIAAAAGIGSVAGAVVRSAREAEGLKIKYPVAVKLLSRDASHKSDVGGVKLGIGGPAELTAAIAEMEKAMGALPEKPAIDGFLVQTMAAEGVECFVGGRQDPVFGPIVTAGLGGVFLEIFKDTSIRLAPVTKSEAMDMLGELKAYPVLRGARGKGKADTDALADIVCRVAHLLAEVPEIAEIDLNPVIVHGAGKGVSVVDSRIFFR